MMELDSNKNLLKFLDKANLKLINSKSNLFKNCLENFPSNDKLSFFNKKCLCLTDKNFGIFAHSDKFLIVSYSVIYLDKKPVKFKIYNGILVVNIENGFWKVCPEYSFVVGEEILLQNCGDKRSKLESAKVRSLVKQYAKELNKI